MNYSHSLLQQGIEAWPMYEDTIFEWMAKIKGLKNTPWEGIISLDTHSLSSLKLLCN